jgi:hypothetical protein
MSFHKPEDHRNSLIIEGTLVLGIIFLIAAIWKTVLLP